MQLAAVLFPLTNHQVVFFCILFSIPTFLNFFPSMFLSFSLLVYFPVTSFPLPLPLLPLQVPLSRGGIRPPCPPALIRPG